MFKVYEVDYHERAHMVGEADTMKDAIRIARAALRESGKEFPCFITCDGMCVADVR